MPGNVVRLTHGARRAQAGRSPIDAGRAVQIRDRIFEDLGGQSECSEVLRVLVSDFAFAVVVRDLLAEHLATVGPLTDRYQRRAALQGWDQVSTRVERLAARIGLERRPRRAQTLEEALAAVEVENDRPGA